MPIRGENIGTAYVRIVGDGSGLDESIRDAFNDAEPSVAEGARDHGRTYGEEFDKEVRKSYKGNFGKTQKEMFDEMNKGLTESLAQLELSDRFFKSKGWTDFRRRLGDEGGAAGDLLGKRLEEHFRDSGDLTNIPNSIKALGPGLRKAQRDILDEMHNEALKINADFDRRMLAQTRDAAQAQAHVQRLGLLQERAIAEDRSRTLRGLREDYGHYLAQLHLVERGERSAALSRSEVVEGLHRVRTGAQDASIPLHEISEDFDVLNRRMAVATPHLSRFNDNLDVMSTRVGRAFGKGSRNDFLNFFGGMIEGGVRLTTLFPKVIEKVTGFGRAMAFTFSDGGGGFGGFMNLVKGAGPLLGSLAGGLGALAIGIGALVAVLGPVIALMSGLLGIITALAGTVVFAAIGALGALVGAAVVAGGAITGLVGAIVGIGQLEGFDDEVNRLGEAFFGLSQKMAKAAFPDFGNTVDRLTHGLRAMEPLMTDLAREAGNFIDGFLDIWSSGPGQAFLNTMERLLPDMVHTLGDAFNNAFSGFLGIIRGLIPITQDFLGWLEKITGEFSNWANSAKGQEEIKDFMDRAADSAKSLGEFIGQVVGLLGDLFSAGKDTGDNIFDSMADSIEEFRGWLDKDGGDNLQQWFEDAEDLAGSLGNMVVQISKFLDALDTPQAREFVTDLIDGASALIGLFSTLSSIFSGLTGFIEHGLVEPIQMGWENAEKLIDAIGGIDLPDFGAMFSGLGGGISDAGSGIGGFFSAIPGQIASAASAIGSFVSAIPGQIGAAMGAVGGFFEGLAERGQDAVQGILEAFISLPFQIIAAITSIPGAVANILERIPDLIRGAVERGGDAFAGLGALAGRAVGAVVGWFRSLPGRIGGFMGRIAGIGATAFSRLGGLAGQAVGAILGWFRTLPGRIAGYFAGIAGRAAAAFGRLAGIAGRAVLGMIAWFRSLPGRVIAFVASIPGRVQGILSRLPGIASGIIGRVVSVFAGLVGRAIGAISSIPGRFQSLIGRLPPAAQAAIGRIVNNFQSLPGNIGRILSGLGGIASNAFGRMVSAASGIPGRIISFFAGLGARIVAAIGQINIPMPNMPDPGPGVPYVPGIASGGMFGKVTNGAMLRWVGEDGPEAIVPLDRSLDQVDPSVRWLSAIAQGVKTGIGGASTGMVSNGRSVNIETLQVITPNTDTRAVATEVVDRLAASGY